MQADRWGGSAWSPWQSHPFIYVNNNPMVFVDPYGLWSMSLKGVLNYTVGTLDGIGQSLISVGTTAIHNLGTTALIAAGAAMAPNLAIIAGTGMAGLAVKNSITTFYENAVKGKDTSRAFGKILVDSAFFYLTAKNVPKAVANLKATMSALRDSVKNLKNVLKKGNQNNGASSSLQGNRLKQQLAAEQAAGVRAPTKINSYSNHALEQIVGRDGGIGVSRAALEDAFMNPGKIEYVPHEKGATFRYSGKNAIVVVNSEGRVVTGWALNSAGIGR